MPTIKDIQGPYRLFFDQREKLICKFWLEPISLSKNTGFSPKELNAIRRIVESDLNKILEAWHEHCGQYC